MTLNEARRHVGALRFGNADCRCGNYDLDSDTREALSTLLDAVDSMQDIRMRRIQDVWEFVDEWGHTYQLRPTGEHKGCPLTITLEKIR